MLPFIIPAVLVLAPVGAFQETNHLIQIDNEGQRVSMDITYDSVKNTVLAVIGDVSKYKGGIQTVNLHDYNTGFGTLKDINSNTCLLGRAPFPKATPEKYRVGFTTEVHDHWLDINSTKLTHEEVLHTAGPNIASFCRDYRTYFVTATPLEQHKRALEDEDVAKEGSRWCIFSKCGTTSKEEQELKEAALTEELAVG